MLGCVDVVQGVVRNVVDHVSYQEERPEIGVQDGVFQNDDPFQDELD